ncbi:unnamed protein product [Merluccius merluccius]
MRGCVARRNGFRAAACRRRYRVSFRARGSSGGSSGGGSGGGYHRVSFRGTASSARLDVIPSGGADWLRRRGASCVGRADWPAAAGCHVSSPLIGPPPPPPPLTRRRRRRSRITICGRGARSR